MDPRATQSRTLQFVAGLVMLMLMAAACGGDTSGTEPAAGNGAADSGASEDAVATPDAEPAGSEQAAADNGASEDAGATPDAEPTGSEQAAGSMEEPSCDVSGRTIQYVTFLRGHPVHQIMIQGFMDTAEELGLNASVVATDSGDPQETIPLAEQALAQGSDGMVVYASDDTFVPFLGRVEGADIPAIVPHFPQEEGTPAVDAFVTADPAEYARAAANAIGEEIGGQGSVALTQGSFNTTENLVSETFTEEMAEKFPDVEVLEPQEEGFDPPQAIATAVALLQANPDVVAAMSTTGGGPGTWAGAQAETGREIVAIGMDYTRENLDLVAQGDIFAIVAQPLYEEHEQSVRQVAKLMCGDEVEFAQFLPAPIVTADDVDPYYEILDRVQG